MNWPTTEYSSRILLADFFNNIRASFSLPHLPAKVSSLNAEPPLSLGGANWPHAPTAVILLPVTASRLAGVKRPFILGHQWQEMCQQEAVAEPPPNLTSPI